MTKRRLLILCLLLLASVGLAWLLWPEPAIGPGSFRRIQIGMNREEVEAVIGMPASYTGTAMYYRGEFQYRTDVLEQNGLLVVEFAKQWSHKSGTTLSRWEGNDYGIDVAFDGSNAVGVYLWKVAPGPGIVDRIRQWLGI